MRVLKYQVPIDDRWHEIGLGEVVLVKPGHTPFSSVTTATVWVLVNEAQLSLETALGIPKTHQFARVFGTGHEVPSLAKHLRSYEDAPFVWHVFGFTSLEKKDDEE